MHQTCDGLFLRSKCKISFFFCLQIGDVRIKSKTRLKAQHCLTFCMLDYTLYQHFQQFALLAPLWCKHEGHTRGERINWDNDESASYKNQDSCQVVRVCNWWFLVKRGPVLNRYRRALSVEPVTQFCHSGSNEQLQTSLSQEIKNKLRLKVV